MARSIRTITIMVQKDEEEVATNDSRIACISQK